MTSVEKWLALGSAGPFALMKFQLVYDGDLVTSGGNSGGRPKDKWKIRKAVHPQLAQLWQTHPVLKGIGLSAMIHPGMGRTLSQSARITVESPSPQVASQLTAPIAIGEHSFVPLVRKSLELACGLDILFLRKEEPGSLILQAGDIDNRVKTLFDALKIPEPSDMAIDQPDAEPFYCLVEQDALITDVAIRTGRLLTKPTNNLKAVILVIDVTVKVMRITENNVGFLGD